MALWRHQDKAVKTLDRYLRRADSRTGAAIITRPTGTGKSAVIASRFARGSQLAPPSSARAALLRLLRVDFDVRGPC